MKLHKEHHVMTTDDLQGVLDRYDIVNLHVYEWGEKTMETVTEFENIHLQGYEVREISDWNGIIKLVVQAPRAYTRVYVDLVHHTDLDPDSVASEVKEALLKLDTPHYELLDCGVDDEVEW